MSSKDIYKVLSNEVRRRILMYIGEKGGARFIELKREFKMSTGSLYYHLGMLRGLVTQSEDKSYVLTEEGERVYKSLSTKRRVNPLYPLASILVMRPLSSALSDINFAGAALGSVALLIAAGIYSAYAPPLLGLYPTYGLERSWLLGVANIFLIWLFIEGVSYMFTSRYGHIKLLLGVGGYYTIYSAIVSLALELNPQLAMYIMILSQSWFILLVAQLLSAVKRLSFDAGVAISLSFLYLNAAAIYLMG